MTDGSESQVSVTGPAQELRPLLDVLKEEGVFVRELSTCDVAYHSPLLDPLLPRPQSRSARLLS